MRDKKTHDTRHTHTHTRHTHTHTHTSLQTMFSATNELTNTWMRARLHAQVLSNPDAVKSAIESALPGKRVEMVAMSDLTFDQQMHLMQRTRVLVGPHGAGLAMLMYLPKGAGIVECTDNPPPFSSARSVAHIFWQCVSPLFPPATQESLLHCSALVVGSDTLWSI